MPDEPFDPNKTAHIIRTDAGARKFIDRVDTMRNEVADLTTEVVKLKASAVPWNLLISILGGAAVVITGASWKVMNSNLERTDRLQAEQLRAIREDMTELRRAAVYSQGTYDVQVAKRPAAIVAREVQAATADAGTK